LRKCLHSVVCCCRCAGFVARRADWKFTSRLRFSVYHETRDDNPHKFALVAHEWFVALPQRDWRISSRETMSSTMTTIDQGRGATMKRLTVCHLLLSCKIIVFQRRCLHNVLDTWWHELLCAEKILSLNGGLTPKLEAPKSQRNQKECSRNRNQSWY
jgi:hypothetical protein